ncbi:signal peptidase I [Idiomarina aminovorans]|uniref:signal peptidase I n=1 Tax=Idiomarina aminovorans TaxID=2914829 RepID=UPI002006CFBB|nr:signal peptidase I [Idiomarina sp. ATCH4]MCK7460494.1 signal peptidase I [Idiomarina sp. ATCH4]
MKKRILLITTIVFSVSAFSREFVQNGSSMEPTIKAGQTVEIGVLSSFGYEPSRWDVVAVKNPQQFNLLVFRIVGLPNETIQLEEDGVYINDKKVKLPEKLIESGVQYLPASAVIKRQKYSNNVYTTGGEEYFLLGDNTFNANDSRFELGIIHRSLILNKVEGDL